MLSFQKEPEQLIQQSNESVSPDNPNLPGEPQDKPSGKNSDNGQEYLTVADRKGQLRQSTYLLVALFVIGVFCLFFMIKKSSPSAASAQNASADKSQQTKIEAAIAKITGIHSQVFNSLGKIVKKFYEFADFEQIDVGELSKNPFRQEDIIQNIHAGNERVEPVINQGELELLTIMSDEKGICCMINDKLLRPGDMINSLTVEEITENSVSLVNDETRIVLKLSESF
jgi:preprotein translocase subunit SecG